MRINLDALIDAAIEKQARAATSEPLRNVFGQVVPAAPDAAGHRAPNMGALRSAADLLAWCFSPAGRRQLERWGAERARYVIDETVRPIMALAPAHPLASPILARAFRTRWTGPRLVA
jgi:hypothetical protein